MKILYIHFNSEKGGAPSSLAHLIKFLPKETIESIVLSPKGPVIETFKNVANQVIELESLPPFFVLIESIKWKLLKNIWQNKNFYRGYKEITKHIDSIQPDIIHLNDSGLFLVARYAKKKGIPVVMHARCVPSSDNSVIQKLILDTISKNVNHLICITKTVHQKYNSIVNSSVIYNPINRLNDDALPTPKTNSNNTLTCLFAANFVEGKGIFDFLHTALLLTEKPIKFIISGKNPRPPQFYTSLFGRILGKLNLYRNVEQDLKAFVRTNNLKNVDIRGYSNNMPELLQETDVIVAPEHSNSTPRIVYEAGLYQVPSILSLTSPIDDILINKNTGIIVGRKNPKELAEAILLLYENSELRRTYGINAQKRYSILHNPDRCAQEVLDIYKALLQSK